MKLSLKLHTTALGPVRAAFLRGNAPQHWLGMLQSWGIPLSDLEAYAVPQSKSDVRVAGLLLILRQGNFPAQLDLQEPYRCIGQALLIPQYASFQPQIAEEEWKNLLIYDWHFFHPGIGMVGFNHSDRVNLANLLAYPAPLEQDWSLAKSGPPAAPPLRQISVVQPKVEDIFAQVQGVGDKDLKDLSKNKPSPEDDKDLRSTLLKSLEKLLSQRPNLREGENQGWLGKMLDRLEMRISQILADLQKQRESEIDRLLKLYQDDPEEALRYSIPLDSPYEGRGIAPPSGFLGRNNAPDFKLGGLNTGGPRDNWNLGAQRQIALRQQYLRLANQKITEGDYRKAAYIHAHLLGDFYTAANVLEQGNHFYEAAILYRDHLKDKQRAAQCFEKGGLYTEAIDLYLELNQKEKAGDLYVQIDQWEKAEKLYQNCADEALKTSNYLEAARIFEHKLKDQNEAKASLLKGWHDKLNPTACLNRYFDFFQQVSNAEFDAEVQRIYQTEYKPIQRNAFIEVLKEIGKNKQRRAELPCTREIVYQIISDELKIDNLNHLGLLETFVPTDRLLGGDLSRYSTTFKSQKTARKSESTPGSKFHLIEEIPLSKNIHWYEAIILNHSLLVLGKKDHIIYMYCSDLEAKSETLLVCHNESNQINHFFALPDHSPYLGITQTNQVNPSLKKECKYYLRPRTHFIECSFPSTVLAIAPVSQDKIAILETNTGENLVLRYSKPNGEILESFLCEFELGIKLSFPYDPFQKPVKMHFDGRYFYFVIPHGKQLIRIDEKGKTSIEELRISSDMYKMAVSVDKPATQIAVSFRGEEWRELGCYLYQTNPKGFQRCGDIFEYTSYNEHLFFTNAGLIVTHKNHIRVYDTSCGTTPRMIKSFIIPNSEWIMCVFKGPKANQVGFLTGEGKVLFYEISDLDP